METIINTVNEVYQDLPETFHVWMLIRETRNKVNRPYLTDGTITRQLRRLRDRGVIKYEIKDRNRSIYKKIKNVQGQKSI